MISNVIDVVIQLYMLVIILNVVFSFIPSMRHHLFVQKIEFLAEKTLVPTRNFLKKMLPAHFPIDLSPLVILILASIMRKIV